VTNWVSATFSAAVDAVNQLVRHEVRPTPFRERNGGKPFNASGVVQVARRRFVFVDNNDPSGLFEFELDSGFDDVEWIRRRPLAGLTDGQVRDPEGLCRIDADGEILLVVTSSLCVAAGGSPKVGDGLVRIRYRPTGDLPAEAMGGFRVWLLQHLPALTAAVDRMGVVLTGRPGDGASGRPAIGCHTGGSGHRLRRSHRRVPDPDRSIEQPRRRTVSAVHLGWR
jgi:hypothetical protein